MERRYVIAIILIVLGIAGIILFFIRSIINPPIPSLEAPSVEEIEIPLLEDVLAEYEKASEEVSLSSEELEELLWDLELE